MAAATLIAALSGRRKFALCRWQLKRLPRVTDTQQAQELNMTARNDDIANVMKALPPAPLH